MAQTTFAKQVTNLNTVSKTVEALEGFIGPGEQIINLQREHIEPWENLEKGYFLYNDKTSGLLVSSNAIKYDVNNIKISGDNTVLEPTNDIFLNVADGKKVCHSYADDYVVKYNVSTTDDTAMLIHTLNTLPNHSYTLHFTIAALNTTDTSNNSASYHGIIKINQLESGTAPNTSTIYNNLLIYDTNLNIAEPVLTECANDKVDIKIKGLLSKTIKWKVELKVIAVS